MEQLSIFTPSIHPAYARLLMGHMQSRELDFDKLFSGSNLSWQSLLDRQRFISFSQFSVLANNAISMTECPWLGIEISSIIQVSSHGPLGYGAIASKNLAQALALIEKMMPTRIMLYRFSIETDQECAFLVVEELLEIGVLSEFIQMMLLGSFMDLLEKVGVPMVEGGVSVSFPFKQPSWIDKYKARFPAVEFHFDADTMKISLPIKWLGYPCLTADEFAHRNAVRECEALMAREQNSGELSERIVNQILSDTASIPSLEVLAERFSMSSRTLIRKLKSEGVSYQHLIDEVRKDVATWKLLNTRAPIDEVAASLGVIDTSNFSRVFRRWFACTPSEFRSRS